MFRLKMKSTDNPTYDYTNSHYRIVYIDDSVLKLRHKIISHNLTTRLSVSLEKNFCFE